MIRLTDAEREAIRRLGGTGFMGIWDWPGTRYRGIRTGVYRQEESAQREVEKGRWRREPRRRVVLVDVNGEVAS